MIVNYRLHSKADFGFGVVESIYICMYSYIHTYDMSEGGFGLLVLVAKL